MRRELWRQVRRNYVRVLACALPRLSYTVKLSMPRAAHKGNTRHRPPEEGSAQ